MRRGCPTVLPVWSGAVRCFCFPCQAWRVSYPWRRTEGQELPPVPHHSSAPSEWSLFIRAWCAAHQLIVMAALDCLHLSSWSGKGVLKRFLCFTLSFWVVVAFGPCGFFAEWRGRRCWALCWGCSCCSSSGEHHHWAALVAAQNPSQVCGTAGKICRQVAVHQFEVIYVEAGGLRSEWVCLSYFPKCCNFWWARGRRLLKDAFGWFKVDIGVLVSSRNELDNQGKLLPTCAAAWHLLFYTLLTWSLIKMHLCTENGAGQAGGTWW